MGLKAQELRIGNLVSILGKTRKLIGVTKWNGRNETGLHYAEFKGVIPIKLVHLKPIPLTKEILLKLGFRGVDDFYFYKKYGKHSELNIDLENYAGKGKSVKHDSHWICDIEFVHQLQNLWFAITGEELETKELCKH